MTVSLWHKKAIQSMERKTMARDFMRLRCWSVVAAAALVVAACGGGGGGSDDTVVVNRDPVVRDIQFGNGGEIHIPLAPYGGAVTSVVEQADGKLVVAGYRSLDVQYDEVANQRQRPKSVLFVNRYLESGQLDSGFGDGGHVEFSVRGADMQPIVSMQGDGSMYVSANVSRPCVIRNGPVFRTWCYVGEELENSKTAWVRLSATGDVDAGIPNEGLALANLPLRLRQMASQGAGQRIDLSNGNYLVFQSSSASVAGVYGWSLERYSADGTKDNSFGIEGVASGRCNVNVGQVVVDGQKNIWVVAAKSAMYMPPPAESGLCLEKLTEGGQPSPSAPEPIKTAMGANVIVHDARLTDDGNLLVAVATDADAYDLKMLKYQTNGQLASSFGGQGILRLQGLTSDQMHWMGLRILDGQGAVGGIRAGDSADPNIWARWLPNGLLDKRFATNGVATMGELAPDARRRQVLVDHNKRWLLQTDVDLPAKASTTLIRVAGDSQ